MGFQCPECGFDIWLPVWEDMEVAVGLYDDARFPGRLILVLKRHHEHLDELSEEALQVFSVRMARWGAILRRGTGAARVNYAVLGNIQPHVHAHLVPRFPADEPFPERPPWEDPRKRESLGRRVPDLVAALHAELGDQEAL